MPTGSATPKSNEYAQGAEAALRTAVNLLTQLQAKVQRAATPPAPPPPQPAQPRAPRP